MAKTVPISLPNGRNWSRKGDAVDHFKAMLSRYSDGGRVGDPTDYSDLAALLQVYDNVLDTGEPTKAGAGVSHFERRKDRDHPGHTSCFFVVRTDGTSIDFSTRRALDVAGARVD
ncbi:MAG: hypothetical protein JWR21_2850 [Herminiimonas sp.]|nr:hypothetical protein [Herminiimonas sp.]